LKVDVALETMRSNDIRRLPVVSDTGRVIGIITLAAAQLAMSEARTSFGSEAPSFERTPDVQDTMTTTVQTVGPDDTIGHAARLMAQHKIGAVPVVQDHTLVGILTESDIFRFVANQLPDGANG
jgi:acetoin utilization protein AcuB